MVEIKAGFDLDMAVAEACGVKCWLAKEFAEPLCLVSGAGAAELNTNTATDMSWRDTYPFQPSVDLNAAFAAAERVASDFYGSLELPPCITLDNRTGWRCTIEDSPEGRGKTAALAICAAILELAKE